MATPNPPAEPADAAEEELGPAARDLITRWGGDPAVLGEGFVAVPISFLRHFALLGEGGLTPAEAMFVLELMSFKWGPRAPFPGYKTLAQRLGVSEPYARKIARSLEAKGLLRREVRVGTTNRFVLTPLFEDLAKKARAFAAKQQRSRERRES